MHTRIPIPKCQYTLFFFAAVVVVLFLAFFIFFLHTLAHIILKLPFIRRNVFAYILPIIIIIIIHYVHFRLVQKLSVNCEQ